MDFFLEDIQNSWTHCKELLASDAKKELVIAFLEEFRSLCASALKKKMFSSKQRRLMGALSDSLFLFWRRQGEISQLISCMKDSKKRSSLLVKMTRIDELFKQAIKGASPIL
ncbi:MAG: hypothetical protein KC535_00730 [Nanoarchaeota archaeon]|nr:hypothetical protein [Nanoarchaeota archaeon]